MAVIKSMTAFGRTSIETSHGLFSIEIYSVNRRTLDIALYLPKELTFLDIDIRKWLKEVISRGSVIVRVNKEVSNKNLKNALPDSALLGQLKAGWGELCDQLDIPREEITLSFLMEHLKALPFSDKIEDEKAFEEEFKRGFSQALGQFMEMKEKEGGSLRADILPRLDRLENLTNEVEKLSGKGPERFREKLEKRIEELSLDLSVEKERVAKEVAFMADRLDISEELVRLKSHIQQFKEAMEQEIVGRKLDFLAQEMNREINTASSKAQDLDVTKCAVDLKSELEKIREQVQNIE